MAWPIEIVLILLCVLWVAGCAYAAWTVRRLPLLQNEPAPALAAWPRISVIIPARNEAATLELAVTTLLRQDYPNLELVLIDDRSTDGTAAIMERLARQDARVVTRHLETLPQGWLGKVHALDAGVKQSSGEWLLFTDADVHFAPDTLRRALAVALGCGIDHITLVPRTLQKGFWLEITVAAFGILFLLAAGARKVNQPSNDAFIGIGAFNLVNASTFRRTPGFEWLRLEPADDVGLGLMMKRAGGRTRVALAFEHLSVEWYRSLAGMFKGLEKNMFGPASGYRWWILLFQVAVIWLVAVGPYIALAVAISQGMALLMIAGVAALSAQGVAAFDAVGEPFRKRTGVLLLPVGLILIGAVMLRAGYRCIRNGGIEWRGTFYPTEQLRAGQRIRF